MTAADPRIAGQDELRTEAIRLIRGGRIAHHQTPEIADALLDRIVWPVAAIITAERDEARASLAERDATIEGLRRERDEARATNRELHRRLQAVEGPLKASLKQESQASAYWFARRKEQGARAARFRRERNALAERAATAEAQATADAARARELEGEIKRLRTLATSACFHFFCCGAGVETQEDDCGQLVPAMAELARGVDFSSDPFTNAEIAAVPPSTRARATLTRPGGEDAIR